MEGILGQRDPPALIHAMDATKGNSKTVSLSEFPAPPPAAHVNSQTREIAGSDDLAAPILTSSNDSSRRGGGVVTSHQLEWLRDVARYYERMAESWRFNVENQGSAAVSFVIAIVRHADIL